MKEFGSDFHFIPPTGGCNTLQDFFPSANYYADGRQALIDLYRSQGWQRLWVPEYFCYDVIASLKEAGLELQFYADKLTGDDRDVLKLRPGITGPATLKYRLEDEMIAEWIRKVKSEELKVKSEGLLREKSDKNLILNLPENIDEMTDQELAIWYNDNVIYPDKVRLNCYYYRHYSFIKDIQMILCTVLGKKMEYVGEII